MKRLILALPAVMMFFVTTLAAHAVTFTTSGGKILKDGAPFTVKGVNVDGLNWYDNRELTQDAGLIADTWRFNAIRVNNVLKVTNSPYTQYSTNNDLDKIVNAFTAKNVVVVMTVQALIGFYANASTSPNITEVSNHWKELAIRYKNNPYVWFDLQNEPGNQVWPENNGADWVALHQRLIKDIRDQGANNIIFVEGSSYGQEGGNYDGATPADGASSILSYGGQLLSFGGNSYGNIVFSLHLYEKWGYETSDANDPGFSSDSKISAFLSKLQSKGYAFVIGEYGSINGKGTMRATQSMFRALQSFPNVGRMVWQWNGGDSNDLTNWDQYYSWSGGGWGITPPNGTRPTNLSTLGALVWDDNRTSAPIAAPVNLISNPSFDAEAYDTQTASGWLEQQYDFNWASVPGTASYTETSGGGRSGSRHLTHYATLAYRVYTYQTKTGLANGNYTARAWGKSNGGQMQAQIEAKDYGGIKRTAALPTTSQWTQISISDIAVSNGTCTIGFWSDAYAGQWAFFDDVEFFKQ